MCFVYYLYMVFVMDMSVPQEGLQACLSHPIGILGLIGY